MQYVHLGRGIHIEQARVPQGTKAHRVCPVAWSDTGVHDHIKTYGHPTHYAWISDSDLQEHPVTCVLPLDENLHKTLAAVGLRCIDHSADQDDQPDTPPIVPPTPDLEPVPVPEPAPDGE